MLIKTHQEMALVGLELSDKQGELGHALALTKSLQPPVASSCNTSQRSETILRPEGSLMENVGQVPEGLESSMPGIDQMMLDKTAEKTLDLLDHILEGGRVRRFYT
jgi:hypothetical protein